MLNRIQLIGRLGRDPELRYTQDGVALARLAVATHETWKDDQGQKQERTEWHRVVLFGRQAEIAAEYLKKGRSVYIEGRLQTRKYTDKDGVEKYATEILAHDMTMLGSREGMGGGGGDEGGGGYSRPAARTAAPSAPAARPAAKQSTGFDDMDDDIPF